MFGRLGSDAGVGTVSGLGDHVRVQRQESAANGLQNHRLVAAEVLDELAAAGHAVDLAATRRNVLTRGIDVNALLGDTFRIGDVLCAGRRLCEPCVQLDRFSGPGLLRPLIHKGGLRVDVLTDGEIRLGALIPMPASATCSRSSSRKTPCATSPDLQAVMRLPVGGLIVTARRRAGGVVSRYFAPAYGIPEDAVTGSAHCTVGPYWRAELGTTLSAEQASPRGGELTVTTDAGRVLFAGQARTAATGFLLGPTPRPTEPTASCT